MLCEPMASLTHLVGAGLALVLLPSLLARVGSPWPRRAAYGVFGLSAVFLLAASGTYHACDLGTEARTFMQRVDHAAIFLLIAGTYTPVVMEHYRGKTRTALLTLVWTLGLGGVITKTILFNSIPQWLSLSWYLAMGWIGLIGAGFLARRVGIKPLLPLVWGGVAYSVGALADGFGWPILYEGVIGPHEVFHIGVLAGLGIHAWLLAQYAHQFRPALANG